MLIVDQPLQRLIQNYLLDKNFLEKDFLKAEPTRRLYHFSLYYYLFIHSREPGDTGLQREEGETILGLPGGRCQSGHLPQ